MEIIFSYDSYFCIHEIGPSQLKQEKPVPLTAIILHSFVYAGSMITSIECLVFKGIPILLPLVEKLVG